MTGTHDEPTTTGGRRPWVEALERVAALDPTVRAFVDEPDRQGRLARAVTPDGPLGGMPIGVKDLYRVDGLPTRAGSALPPEVFDGEQSWIVSRLREAGAVVVGKTYMDEFAYCEPPPTKNPRDLTRTPDGSSGGSAAAVAAGMCPLALGSQTLHSTIGPAAYCGIIGFKPSLGRWPFDGVALSPAFDTLGFLADTLTTLARVTSVLPGWTSPTTRRPVVGVPEVWGVRRLHTEGWTAFRRHLEVLRAAGYEIATVRLPWNEDPAGWSSVIADLLLAEMAEVHRPWFDAYRHLYRPRTAEAVERGRAIRPERVVECLARRQAFIDSLNHATEYGEVDGWICPSAGSVATPFEGAIRDTWMTRFWSLAGSPTISLPVFDGQDGLPHGIQLAAPQGHDEQLLDFALGVHAVLLNSANERSPDHGHGHG